jgi:beta-N-acetylhexosaminidase
MFTQRRYGAAPFPGNMALGATDSQEMAYDAAEATARELRSFGIQITFAPALDVNSNPNNPIIGLRSFGQDPEAAARLGRAALRGYRAGGMLAVPKHFPGHGDTSNDSHLGLPVSTKTLSELEATELVPFRAAFAAGAEAVMPAHMVFPALGAAADQPVTLSSAVIEGFLRGKMGFKGLVVSDSLDMGAIANVYGSSEAAILSLLAGNDVLLLGKGDYPAAFAAVVGAVNSGRIPRARLEKAVSRILDAKRKLGLFDADSLPKPLDPEMLARDRALAQHIAESAVTLARNDGTVPLKLKKDETLGLVLVHAPRYAAEAARFADQIAKRHARTTFVDIAEVSPSTSAVADALARTRGAAAVIVGTSQFGGPVPETQARLLKELIARPAPVVAVSLMNPYDLPVSRGARAAVCAYGMTDSALDAAARLIFGEIPALGRLPVTIPGN